jgi:hypothetical protein
MIIAMTAGFVEPCRWRCAQGVIVREARTIQ